MSQIRHQPAHLKHRKYLLVIQEGLFEHPIQKYDQIERTKHHKYAQTTMNVLKILKDQKYKILIKCTGRPFTDFTRHN